MQKTFFAALAIGLLPSAFAGPCVSYTGSCPADKPHCAKQKEVGVIFGP
ncbi:hypothetical protein OOU_Y34scaffold01162g2 [Pyricularia oryzae Y34]|uniref:Uncharacterized protein n=2 Tax=Pyricularia oryzae TaxID=318829 RepID=A0AA97PF97_PYRO3|nr:hypothetical protein OOU_Y34scaffold01162g2 [Pyricularia oryzae Y34]